MGNLLRRQPPRPADEQRVLHVLVYHPAANTRLYSRYLARVSPTTQTIEHDVATVQRRTSTVRLHWCGDMARVKTTVAAPNRRIDGLMLIVDAARPNAAREAYDECASLLLACSPTQHAIELSTALTLDDMIGAFHSLFSAVEKAAASF